MKRTSLNKADLKYSLTIIFAACVLMGCGELRPTHEDAKKAFSELVQVQEAHQKSIADFAVARAPQYTEIIKRDTMLVLLEWRRRQLQFEYLIDHDPERLRLRRGREGLVSFQWTAEDSTNLARRNATYLEYERKIADLKPWIEVHKWGDTDVVLFFENLEKQVEMKSLRRVYGRDEQAIVLRYRLAAILKEE